MHNSRIVESQFSLQRLETNQIIFLKMYDTPLFDEVKQLILMHCNATL